MRNHVAVISQGLSLRLYQLLFSSAKHIIDLFDPLPLELLQHGKGTKHALHRSVTRDRLRILLRFGDHFICACPEQRDFWLGALSAVGRINRAWQRRDPSLSDLIDTVPFGIARDEPHAAPGTMRKYFPALPGDAQVLWWGGGLWDWMDPLTLIRAMSRLRQIHPEYHLVFPGIRHPNPNLPAHAMVDEARALARKLDLEANGVWLGDGWIPYDQRGACMKEAVAGVSMHHRTVEAHFSFRTRLLDYLWGGLPVIASGGDPLGERARREGWGLIVEPGNEDALLAALIHFAGDDELRRTLRERVAASREDFRWEVVIAPLVRLIRDERRAPDRPATMVRLVWWTSQTCSNILKVIYYAQWRLLFQTARGLLGRALAKLAHRPTSHQPDDS
jgi:glycosyltransferase involved in cell wall biosynthesis